MAATRSMRKGLVTGFTPAAKRISSSTLATAGRMKLLRRGRIRSIIAAPRLPAHLHQIAGQGRQAPPPQNTAAPAGNDSRRGFHVVLAADGAQNSSCQFLSHLP